MMWKTALISQNNVNILFMVKLHIIHKKCTSLNLWNEKNIVPFLWSGNSLLSNTCLIKSWKNIHKYMNWDSGLQISKAWDPLLAKGRSPDRDSTHKKWGSITIQNLAQDNECTAGYKNKCHSLVYEEGGVSRWKFGELKLWPRAEMQEFYLERVNSENLRFFINIVTFNILKSYSHSTGKCLISTGCDEELNKKYFF